MGFRIAGEFAVQHGIALDREDLGGVFGRGQVRCASADAESAANLDVGVLLPLTYMNLSGDAVAEALAELPIEDPVRDLLVVVDDVDLPFGRLRVRGRGGAGGQRGLAHVIERLGRQDFPRLRFGIGRPDGGYETADHVLQGFSDAEEKALPAHVTRAVDAVTKALCEGAEAAMDAFNRDPEASPGEAGDP